MSQENVEIVKANYEAFASRGLDGWMEQFADDVECRAPDGSRDDVGPIHGKTALRAWLQQWMDPRLYPSSPTPRIWTASAATTNG